MLAHPPPFALSLSKGSPFFRDAEEGEGFDRLSPNRMGREGK